MAGGTIGGGDDEGLITGINVTPLVDVVLVLLIILMVTASALVEMIPMELPEASSGQQDDAAQPTTVAISIDEDGELFIDRDPVGGLDGLRARVRALHDESPDLRAIIAADGRIQHQRVIQVIDLLRQEEVNKFAFNVRPSDLQDN